MKVIGCTGTHDLFNPPPPRQHHSETSCEAADAIEPKAGTLRSRVLNFLRERGTDGATDGEMQAWLDMNPSTQRPRRIELQKLGLVYDSGLWRYTMSGRRATVWRADIEKGVS